MPVQKKSRTTAPGEKDKKNWLKIGAAAVVVIIVVMCVLSFSNFSNLFSGNQSSGLTGTITEGTPAAIYFQTNIGNTTTFSYVGQSTDELQPYRVVADTNSSVTENDYHSIFIRVGNTTLPYGIYALEINKIAQALVGHQYGETITVDIPYLVQVSCTASDVAALGYDITQLKVGDVMPITLGYEDILGDKKTYLRNGIITSISSDLSGLTLNCGCDTIDVVAVGRFSA